MATIIDSLVTDNRALIEFLGAQAQPSFAIEVNNGFRKTLLLSSASYFESLIKDAIVDFTISEAGVGSPLVKLVRMTVIERHYFTLFEWKAKNANKFFSHFGDGFREAMQRRMTETDWFAESVKAFLEIGDLRNRLVHQNFASFEIEKTAEEIYALYQSALRFVEDLPSSLSEHARALRGNLARDTAVP
jgi:hypothetical protein